MLEQFRVFQVNRMDLEELVALAAYGRTLRDEFEKQKVEEPEFIDVNLKALRREIQSRVADKTDARRRQIRTKLDSLKTPAEKRAELEAELAAMDAVPV